MSHDSSDRFAALELDLPSAPIRPIYTVPAPKAPMMTADDADITSGSNRQGRGGYNNANDCATLAECLAIVPELAGTVVKEQLFTADGESVPDAFATIRTYTSGKRQALGVVGRRYKVVQDSEAFDMVQALLDSGAISSLNAGAYKAKTWIYGESVGSQVEIIPGDVIEQRVLFGNSHDGSIPWSVGLPGNRVVCQNTFAHAMSSKLSRMLRLRHTGSVIELIGQVREAITVAGMEFVAAADQFKFMASKPCTEESLKEYTGYVFSKWADTEDEVSEESTGGRVYAKVLENYESGAGSDMTRGTAWGAFNAVTEYLTHQRGRGTDQSRFADLQWGAGANLNRRALDGAMSLASR